MKKLFPIIFLLCLLFMSDAVYARYVTFEFSHSRRIPYNRVHINIEETYKGYIMKVQTSPGSSDPQWQYSKKDFTKNISKQEFESLYSKIYKAYLVFDPTKDDIGGVDGTTWVLKLGNYQNNITLEIWSPDYQTEARSLTDFVQVCTEIVKLSGLPIDETLGEVIRHR